MTDRADALKAELFGSDLTVDEVAYILSVDRTTVLRYLRDDVLFGFCLGRQWHIPEAELRAYKDRLLASKVVAVCPARHEGLLGTFDESQETPSPLPAPPDAIQEEEDPLP